MGDSVAFLGGRVFTGQRFVEALLVEDGVVRAAGSRSEVGRSVPTGAERIDLGGDLVLPGLIDAHLHLGGMAIARDGVDLRGCPDIPSLLERIRARSTSSSSGPIVGNGWDQERLAERRFPTREELDRAVPDRPVVLYRVCGHAAVLNSKAEEAIEPTRAAGRRSGSSTTPGALFEGELDALGPIRDEWLHHHQGSVRGVLEELPRYGLTSVGTLNASRAELTEAAEAIAALDGPVAVVGYLPISAATEAGSVRAALSGSAVALAGAKGFLDGALGIRTAALTEPYSDSPATRGELRGEPAWWEERIDAADDAGLAPALHAIGDAAIVEAAKLLSIRRRDAPRGRIEHVSVAPGPVLRALERVRPVLVVQPSYIDSDVWLTERLGAERAQATYCLRTLLARGHDVAGSSDAPVERVDPWSGMQAAIRKRPSHPSPEEWLEPAQAVGLYTGGSAKALAIPDRGHLEPGARGDLVRVRAPSIERAVALGASGVTETWRGGRRTFGRQSGKR